MDLAKYALFQARLRESEPAIAFAGGVATYGLLARAVAAAVDRLGPVEVPAGGFVAITVSNPFRHTVLMLALALMGIPSASISGRAQVEFSGVTPAVCLSDKPDFSLPGCTTHLVHDDWFSIDPEKPVNYDRLLGLKGFTDPSSLVRVIFSSGTTGYPKAVAMTLGVLEASITHGEMTQAGPHQHAFRAINMMGFSTVGSIIAILIVLSRGGVLAFSYDAGDALRLIRAFQIEILSCAVVQLQSVLKALGTGTPPGSLKTVIASGARIAAPLLLEARARLCPNVNVMYGSTEAGPISFGTGAALDQHEGSAGFVLPWVTLEIVDGDGQKVSAGSDGIIRLRTAEQSTYLVASPETDAMFRDGWFYPGDVGQLHADGMLVITGRSSEIINRGGVIAAPDMIEGVLRTIPGIKDAAVFGAPDAQGVDEIWAALVSDQWVDPNAIKAVAAVRLPDRKPDHVVQVESIPRNEMGKIRRAELRETVLRARKAQ